MDIPEIFSLMSQKLNECLKRERERNESENNSFTEPFGLGKKKSNSKHEKKK